MFPRHKFKITFVIPRTGKRLSLVLDLKGESVSPEERADRDIILQKKIAAFYIEVARLTKIDDDKKAKKALEDQQSGDTTEK